MFDSVELYDNTYGNFADSILEEIRRAVFGEDIGQNSWLTADEYRRFFKWLELDSSSNVLEIACGSGGPALFMARTTGCRVLGLDNNENGFATANKMAEEQGLAAKACFQLEDASQPLRFENEIFDSIVCIDAINHLPNRSRVLAEWRRVLKPNGRLLFTDPIIVTGSLSGGEIAVRSSIGYFLFVPVGENERLLKETGFELIRREDATENEAQISKGWRDARGQRRDDLIKIEGEDTFERLQRFLAVVCRLSSERRLSRFVFVAGKK
jgi:cyclopropane fatty-acyl-phospholipid synthase-like methyltransferase